MSDPLGHIDAEDANNTFVNDLATDYEISDDYTIVFKDNNLYYLNIIKISSIYKNVFKLIRFFDILLVVILWI